MPEAEITKPQELSRLRKQLLRALYIKPHAKRARVYADRMQKALEGYQRIEETLLGRDCLALVAEAREQYPLAIKHRTQQLELLAIVAREARNIAASRSRAIVTKMIATDRITVLAFLTLSMWSLGKLPAALKQLTQMKRECTRYKLEFFGNEIQSDIRRQLQRRPKRLLSRSEKAEQSQYRVPRSEEASHFISAQTKHLAA
ncbi:MAG TPA: hypothetical protein VNO30_38125 [Kofleriaceae bacterium]|nr:hypothetical protein [Kofleriaceae bacterium]